MSPVNQPVQNGVSHGGIADQFVPAGGRELAGDQRRGRAVAIIQHLQQVAVLSGRSLFQPKEGVRYIERPLRFGK